MPENENVPYKEILKRLFQEMSAFKILSTRMKCALLILLVGFFSVGRKNDSGLLKELFPWLV